MVGVGDPGEDGPGQGGRSSGARPPGGTPKWTPPRRTIARLERVRKRRRRRNLALAVVLVVVAGLIGYTLVFQRRDSGGQRGVAAQPTGPAGPSPAAAPPAGPTAAGPTGTAAAPQVPVKGPGTFAYAPGTGKVLGAKGTLRTFKVAVEKGVGADAAAFAERAETILGDPRSWIAGKNLRLQRVKSDQGSTFTVYLATPGTALTMCLAGGVDIRIDGTPYTSCRAGSHVIINMARFVNGIPHYGARLDVYRQYAINHEVGHALGHGHELCPGQGRPAPVMQQQTLSMQGCLANAWPYVDGKRYAGPSGHL